MSNQPQFEVIIELLLVANNRNYSAIIKTTLGQIPRSGEIIDIIEWSCFGSIRIEVDQVYHSVDFKEDSSERLPTIMTKPLYFSSAQKLNRFIKDCLPNNVYIYGKKVRKAK